MRILSRNKISTVPFYAVSFLSGAAALIYQVTWIKKFSSLFGLQVLSVSLVLGTFMAGLAVGSLIFGRLSDRKSPLLLYVLLEFALALFAVLFPLLFQKFSDLYTFLGGLFNQSLTGIHLLRFILSFMFLIIPSTCIGGTLPVLVRIVTKQIGGLGRNLGLIYAINSLGALAGCLITGFFLIKNTGISGSMIAGAILNLFNAALILGLNMLFSFRSKMIGFPEEKTSHWSPNESAMEAKQEGLTPGAFTGTTREVLDQGLQPVEQITGTISQYRDTKYLLNPLPRSILILLLVVFTVEGFTTLSFEVLWTRVFTEFSYDKSVYLYSVIIAGFIAGLSLGSFIISKYINRIADPVSLMGWLETGIGLLSLVQLILATVYIPVLIEKRELYSSWAGVSGREYLFIFLFIQFPVILMGMTLPVIGRLFARNMEDLGRKIGIIGMLDTLGSIAGSFIGGFVMLPLLGVAGSIILTALLNIIMGILILGFHPEKKLGFRRSLVPAIILTSFLLIVLHPRDPYFKTKFGKKPGEEIVYYNEAACGTVTIHRYPLGYSALSINGVLFAYNTSDDLRSHRMLACMPYFFNSRPEDVLVLGFGLGITAGFFTVEDIKSITVAEICPPVIQASALYFAYPNHDIKNDRRLQIIPEDGRAWLLCSDRKFDIITCDAIHPRFGNNLYTREYYELCREHLTEDGVICQWMPTNWMTEYEYKSLLKTFQSVFPDASLWYVNRGVTLAVGTIGPKKIPIEMLLKRMDNRQIRDDLAETDILGPEMLLARFCMKGEEYADYCRNGKINTDDHPFVEYGREFRMAPNPDILQSLQDAAWNSYDIMTGWDEIKRDTSGFDIKLNYSRATIREELLQDIERLRMEELSR
jgi:spermidine synthase